MRTVGVFCMTIALGGCSIAPTQDYRAPYSGIDAFGPEQPVSTVPMATAAEVDLGRVRQANGKFIADDGTFEVKKGVRGSCVYAFKVSRQTGRMLSWRVASRGDPKECL